MSILERMAEARRPPVRDPLAGVPGRRRPPPVTLHWIARPGVRLAAPPGRDPASTDELHWHEVTL